MSGGGGAFLTSLQFREVSSSDEVELVLDFVLFLRIFSRKSIMKTCNQLKPHHYTFISMSL